MEIWVKNGSGLQVEAVRLNEDNVRDVARWCGAQVIEEIDPEHPEEFQYGLNVDTNDGVKRASLGMYVIKFARTFHVSYPRPFEIRYSPLNRISPPLESAGDSRKARGFADPFDRGRNL